MHNRTCVVVLSFNHPHLTSKCLDSLLEKVDGQKIILVHNGSLVDNQVYLENRYPSLTHFKIEKNEGYTKGVNLALNFAFEKYDWVYFYTNDVLTNEIPQTEPIGPGLFIPKIWRRKEGVVDSIGGRFNPMSGKIWHCKSIEEFNQKSLFSFPYFPGTAFLIHKEIFNKVGVFDQGLHTYWEDVDYSMRMFTHNLTIGVVHDWILIHKVGKTCHKDKFYTSVLFHRNKNIIVKRYRKRSLHLLINTLKNWFAQKKI